MTESVFICPVCGQKLFISGKSYKCPDNHCFDIAKSGYVNLLTSSSQGRHGDDRVMVRARTSFLDGGYYGKLREAVTRAVSSLLPDGGTVLDAGCGEGYYSSGVENSGNYRVIGIDISKYALMAASKRSSTLILAAASTSSVPLEDLTADAVLNIFSPLFPEEFSRILTPDGFLIRVIPLERHLLELKELVYDNPYLNPAPELEINGFELLSREDVRYRISVRNNADICNLFAMTPYYYKTGINDQNKLKDVSTLDTELEFAVLCYRKAG